MSTARGISSPASFNKDDEALRLLQQLAAEQSELLDRLHIVNPSALAASAVIVRPAEQYLTIALNGKNTDLIGLQHLVSCIFAMSTLLYNIERSDCIVLQFLTSFLFTCIFTGLTTFMRFCHSVQMVTGTILEATETVTGFSPTSLLMTSM